MLLWQVIIWDEQQHRRLTFLANLMPVAPSTIAPIYKERWQIELLFKSLEAASQDQDVCGYQRERRAGPNLDRADRHVAAEVAAAEVSVALEPLEPRRVASL